MPSSTLSPSRPAEALEQHAQTMAVLHRAITHVSGLRRLWHLIDAETLAWMVAQFDRFPPDLVTRRMAQRGLASLLEDAEIPAVLRNAIAQLVVRSRAVPIELLCASPYSELRLAAALSTAPST